MKLSKNYKGEGGERDGGERERLWEGQSSPALIHVGDHKLSCNPRR